MPGSQWYALKSILPPSRPNLVCWGRFQFVDRNPKHRGWKQIDRGEFDQEQEMTQATGCAMLVRSDALREIGLLDEQFWAYAEDLDWSLRFLKQGYRLGLPRKHIFGITME